VQKNFRRGLTLLVAYTWSSNWDNLYGSPVAGLNTLNPNPSSGAPGPQDNYNLKGEYSRATNDKPNRFTAAISYELPIGRGRPIFGDVNRLVDAFVGGWQINSETIIENGGPQPMCRPTSAQGPSGRRELVEQISARIGYRELIHATALDSTTPTSQSTKNFSVTGKINFQFRAEALNALNTPEFGQPGNILTFSGSSLTSATYTLPTGNATIGAVTSQLGFSRIIQLGGRLTFRDKSGIAAALRRSRINEN
jgi:trimeric autotransporter adhesin